jgi:hypothetical protein
MEFYNFVYIIIIFILCVLLIYKNYFFVEINFIILINILLNGFFHNEF